MNLASIATGELFRSAIKGETELGKRIKAVYDRGELVPDDITVALVEERLDSQESQGPKSELVGALYDGFPRTAAQAQALDEMLARRSEEITAAIAIDVPREKLIERLSGRRVCSVCGRVYNVVSDPPKQAGLCDIDGGELIQRADDTPEAVAKRLDLYELETAPLVDRYAERGLVVHIDGDRPIDDVTNAVIAAIMERSAVVAREASA
jgi:adenylate kinase